MFAHAVKYCSLTDVSEPSVVNLSQIAMWQKGCNNVVKKSFLKYQKVRGFQQRRTFYLRFLFVFRYIVPVQAKITNTAVRLLVLQIIIVSNQ